MFIVHLPSSVELGNRNLVEWLEELLWHLVQAHTLNLYFTFVHLYFTFVFPAPVAGSNFGSGRTSLTSSV